MMRDTRTRQADPALRRWLLLPAVLGLMLVACGSGLLAAGAAPLEWVQQLGPLLRRASDVTPERVSRFRQVCGFFGGLLLTSGFAMFWSRRRIGRVLVAFVPKAFPRVRETSDEETILPWERFAMAASVVLGVAVRAWRLFDSMAYDEAYTFLNFARRPWYEAISDYNSTNNHLLNTLLMHLAYRMFGAAEWSLRLPVFLAGSLLPLAVWRWARRWRGRETAVITAAITAIAPALITYSVDARGYILVTLAAVIWDDALGCLSRAGTRSCRQAIVATLALTAGLCAMPIMAYSALAGAAWFLAWGLLPDHDAAGNLTLRDRAAWLTGILGVSAVLVLAFYAPSYMLRGLMFLNDPIMRPAETGNYWTATMGVWQDAARWWTAGPFPGWCWGLALLAGLFRFGSPGHAARWLAPFVLVVLINAGKHSLPPPRIFLFLLPWIALLTAEGVSWLVNLVRQERRPGVCMTVTLSILLAGAWHVGATPILIHPEERALFADVRDVIGRLLDESPPELDARTRLAAPLPVDLPSLYYLARAGRTLNVNGSPQPEESLWLITRRQELPAEALSDGVVRWRIDGDWELRHQTGQLSLHRLR